MKFTIINDEDDVSLDVTLIFEEDNGHPQTVTIPSGEDHIFTGVDSIIAIEEAPASLEEDDEDEDRDDADDDGVVFSDDL